MKRHTRGLGSISLAMLAVLFLIVAPAEAQKAATTEAAVAEPEAEPVAVGVTTSEASTPVTGSTTGSGDELGANKTEPVTFSGNVAINAAVVTDPALPTGVSLFVDCKGLRGSDDSGTAYITSCEANVTRLFRRKDTIVLTFAYFEDKPGAFLNAKTGKVTLNLTYNEATKTLTGATGVVSSVDETATTGTF